MSAALAVPRGCGTRKSGGLYAECGLSPWGVPIEELLIDPPLGVGEVGTLEWFEPHRTPILVERDGVHHLVIYVGAEYYPNIWDFIEEGRVAGFSRRLPTTFDFAKITAESRMIFVHRAAKVDATPIRELTCDCPKRRHTFVDTPTCLGAAKYLPSRVPEGYRQDGDRRTLPCGHSYSVSRLPAIEPPVELRTAPAVFLQTSISGVSYVRTGDSEQDAAAMKMLRPAGVETFEVDQ